jgi:hypothetical protein
MKIKEFKMEDWQKVRDFWKSLNFLTPFDRKWVYERKIKEYPDLFLIAEDNGKIVGTCIANYDVQLSYIRFLIKDGYEKIGTELLREMENRLKIKGTLAMFIVPHKGKPCEKSLKSIKLKGLNKYANCEFWAKFLNKKEDIQK